jgi:HK97 family phage major capsid protein
MELTKEQLDKQMQETTEKIEKALTDLRKGTATREETIKLIDERVGIDKEAAKQLLARLEELKSVQSEIHVQKEQSDQLRTQIRNLQAGGYAALKDGSGNYRGKFRSPEEARLVGLSILGASLPRVMDFPGVKSKYDRIMKAIEKTGFDPIFVDGETGKRIEKAAMTTSQASGSLLVTSEMAPGLIVLMERYGLARKLAGPMPMGAASTFQPKMDTLPTFYVPGEGAAPTVTDPTIGGITLTLKTLQALGAYSIELDEDSAIAVGELYGNWFAAGAAYYEDLCWLLGDGTSTYFNFVGICGALRAVDATIGNIRSLVVGTGNAYSELVYSDFEGVVGTLPDYADANAEWIMHRYFYYTVFIRAALAAGTAGAHSEIILGTAQRQKLACGYPVNFSAVMPKAEANNQICSLFGDYYNGSKLGTRGGLEFASSDQVYWSQGLIGVRCRDRIAINPRHGVGNTTNPGPIVGLITAAN